MRRSVTTLALFTLILMPLQSPSQVPTTSGIGHVIAIESKAQQFDQLNASLSKAKAELPELEVAWQQKLTKLRGELSELYAEMNSRLRDYKQGFFCSECRRTKTEIEKSGLDFYQHVKDVKGHVVPATTEEFESLRESYKQKIAYKKVQIQHLEKGDAAVLRKRQVITSLEKQLAALCDEITRHSQAYERTLETETKNKQLGWIKDLMNYASEIFIAEDKIAIYEARILALSKSFAKESVEERDRVEDQNLEEREIRTGRIAANKREIDAQASRTKELIDPLELRRTEINERINAINAELRRTSLPETVRQELLQEKATLTADVTRIEREIGGNNLNHSKTVANLERANDLLSDEIFRLTSDLPKQQEAAVARLKVTFEKRKSEIRADIAVAGKQLTDARTAYKDREAFFSKANDAFYLVVGSESDRMVVAGKAVSCPIANQSRQFVAQNWNVVRGCVSTATTRAKPYSTNVFGSYCPSDVSASAFGKYRSFLLSLSGDDLSAVKANSNVGWYESLVGKEESN